MNRQNTSHHIPQRSTLQRHNNVSSKNINTSLNLSSINNLNSVSNARLKEIQQPANLSVCLPPSAGLDKSPISRVKDSKARTSKENLASKNQQKKNDNKQQQILKGVLKSSYSKLSSQPKPQNTNLQRLKFEKSCAIIIEPLKNKDSNRVSHLYSFSHRRDSASSKTKKGEEIPGNNHKSTSRILQQHNNVKSSLGPAPTKSFFAQKNENKTLSQILRKSQERINTLKNEKVLEELESQQNESSFFSMNYQYRRQSMGDAEIPKFEPTQNKRLSVPTLMTQEFETENIRCKTDYYIARDEGLYRANLFGEKLNGLLKGLMLKQKMGFFMKLRENMHLYQWKLSKFAKAQEAKKKGFYFRTWEKYIRVKRGKFPCASARLNKTTFENPKTTAAESQKLTLKKLLDKNMQSLHLNLNKILEEDQESHHVNKSVNHPKDNNNNNRFYAKRGSAPDVTLFDLKSTSSISNNNNFVASHPHLHSHSQSVIFNPAAFKDSGICNNSLETSFASISEKNCKNQQNNLLRKSEDLLSFKQSQVSNDEQHSLGINLSSFNKDCESHNTSMTDQILTNIPQPVQRDGLDISAYESFNAKEKVMVAQKKPTSTSKISQPKIKQNITTVNKDKSKATKRPENGMYLSMKQDLEKKIQQSMSATKVVKKSRNESSFIKNNESQETDISIRKDSKQQQPMKKPQEKSFVKFEKILPQPEHQETKFLQKSFEKKLEDAIIESNHEIIINNEKALQFRKIKLIQTYFNRLLLTTQLIINRKNEAAEYLQIRNLLKKGFIGLSTGTMSIAPESEASLSNSPCFGPENPQNNSLKEEEEFEIKMQIAENYYESTTKMNIFNALLEKSQEQNKSFDEYRKGYLMRACFVKWFENKSALKGEEDEDDPDVFAYEGDLPTFRSINNENEEKVEKDFVKD